MRLAFSIFKHFPFGGIQRDMLKIVRECLERGHEVRIYAIRWRDERPPPEGVELCLAPVRALTNHRLHERFAAWVGRDVQRRPVDLLVGMNKMPGLDVYYAGDTCYQEKALTQRTFLHRLLPRHRSLLRAEQAVFEANAATRILTIADNQARIFRHHYGTGPERFHSLPPGIEPNRGGARRQSRTASAVAPATWLGRGRSAAVVHRLRLCHERVGPGDRGVLLLAAPPSGQNLAVCARRGQSPAVPAPGGAARRQPTGALSWRTRGRAGFSLCGGRIRAAGPG